MFVVAAVFMSGHCHSVLHGCAGITPDYAFPHSDWIIFYMATL